MMCNFFVLYDNKEADVKSLKKIVNVFFFSFLGNECMIRGLKPTVHGH